MTSPLAPTTLEGQVTKTSPRGRMPEETGAPLKVPEMLAVCDQTKFLARCALNSPKNIRATKRALKKAFRYQLDGVGFSLVEILSPCPTYWGVEPLESLKWIEQKVIPRYPLGVIKDAPGEGDEG